MLKRRLHFHTDCDFFAGCENMLVNFLTSQHLADKWNLSVSCRWSGPYAEGWRERIGTRLNPDKPLIFGNDLFLRVSMPVTLRKFLNLVLLMSFWIFIWNVVVLFFYFRGKKINVLHINNGGFPGANSCRAAAVAAKLAGIGSVYMVVNNYAYSYKRLSRKIDWPLDQIVIGCVDAFVTGSQGAAKALRENVGVLERKLVQIHNGIAPRPIQQNREDVRNRLGIPQDKVVLGIVAILEPRKGHTYLLNAMKTIKESGIAPVPVLLIEGRGPLQLDLARRISEQGLEDCVRMIGDEKRIFDFLNAIDVFILPSIAQEDFPNVNIEAMSLGKPVISTILAGIPEQIEDGFNGFLVPPCDSMGLVKAIKALVQDASMRLRMGQNGASKYQNYFTVAKATANYQALYESRLVGV